MRILVTTPGAIGHVHPLIPLARALRDAGHEVLWATGPDATPRVEAAGIPARPAGAPWETSRAELRRRYPEIDSLAPEDLPDMVFPRLFGEIAAEAMVDDVVAIAREMRPDLIVHDAGELAAPIAASLIGVAHVTRGFGALVPRSRMEAASGRVARLWRAAGLEPRPFGGSYDHLYLDPYPPGLQPFPMDHVPDIQAIRPVAYDESGDAAPFDPPPGDAPLIYVTLGTISRDPVPLRTAVQAIAGLPVRVLATVGPSLDPAALGPQPANVRVERYVAQTQVLAHCAAIATHTGSGTFLGALAAGIPQLCLPQAADQFLNARACLQAGAGLRLTPEEATVSRVRSAVARLLAEPGFRDAARRVGDAIAAMPSPDDVVPVLETVAARR